MPAHSCGIAVRIENSIRRAPGVAARFSSPYTFQLQQGIQNDVIEVKRDVNYNFLDGVPNSITQSATPFETKNRTQADLGIYVQDRWTLNSRALTMGCGSTTSTDTSPLTVSRQRRLAGSLSAISRGSRPCPSGLTSTLGWVPPTTFSATAGLR